MSERDRDGKGQKRPLTERERNKERDRDTHLVLAAWPWQVVSWMCTEFWLGFEEEARVNKLYRDVNAPAYGSNETPSERRDQQHSAQQGSIGSDMYRQRKLSGRQHTHTGSTPHTHKHTCHCNSNIQWKQITAYLLGNCSLTLPWLEMGAASDVVFCLPMNPKPYPLWNYYRGQAVKTTIPRGLHYKRLVWTSCWLFAVELTPGSWAARLRCQGAIFPWGKPRTSQESVT